MTSLSSHRAPLYHGLHRSSAAVLVTCLLSNAFLVTEWARADGAESKAAARELAVEGIQLAQKGDCDTALPKLLRAEALYHAPTILTWIGECQIKGGELVEGTENLNRVMQEQLASSAPQAFRDAQVRAKQLRAETLPKIARLTLEVQNAELEGLVVEVDGKPVPTAMFGAPRPTDPGERTVKATAPGYLPFEHEMTLGEAARETLRIELAADPNAPPPATDEPAPTAATSTPPEEKKGSGLKTAGWIGVGVGGALLIGGGVLGGMALGEKGALECTETSDGFDCPSSQQDRLDSANTYATTSTILFAAGGAIAATGIVLLFVGRSGSGENAKAPLEAKLGSVEVAPTFGFTSVGLSGRF